MGLACVFFKIAIYVLLSVMMGVFSTETYMYHGDWQHYFGDKSFLTLMNVPVQTCIMECRFRHVCLAVNFWRVRKVCEMFLSDTGPVVHQGGGSESCIFIKMSDVRLAIQPTIVSSVLIFYFQVC